MSDLAQHNRLCSKCNLELPLESFHKDKSKEGGIYPSCKDCRRLVSGAIKIRERTPKRCKYCGTTFHPRNGQVDGNKAGHFFCCNDHYHAHGRENRETYGKGYQKHIRERDGNCCTCCGKTFNLHVHHIVFRSQQGDNSYKNLITLCAFCHTSKAHGEGQKLWRDQFLRHTSKFDVPDFWQEMKANTEMGHKRALEKNRRKGRERYKKIKASPVYQEYQRKRSEYAKEYYQKMKAAKKKEQSTYT